MSQPPRHTQLIRVDPCLPWLKTATHTGRFTPAARRIADTSIREASCLSVLTAAITRHARGKPPLENGRSRARRAWLCSVCILTLQFEQHFIHSPQYTTRFSLSRSQRIQNRIAVIDRPDIERNMPSCLHLPRIHKAIGKNLLRGLHISGTRQSMNASLFPGIQHHEETQCNQTSSHSIHRVGRLRLAYRVRIWVFHTAKKHTRDIVPTSTILCGRTGFRIRRKLQSAIPESVDAYLSDRTTSISWLRERDFQCQKPNHRNSAACDCSHSYCGCASLTTFFSSLLD